jgi:predicted lipid-binding transport protein (Tim44 family)
MSDFLEDLGKKLSDAAAEIGKKTEDTLEIQKLKSDIRSLNRGNERDYIDIGKLVYEKYQNGEVVDGDISVLCEAVDKRDIQIGELKAEIVKIRGED